MLRPATTEIAPGIWRWTSRHPQWHPGEFGAEVASFALVVSGGGLLLIDPLLPDVGTGVITRLDKLTAAAKKVHVYITIPYHVRSTREIVERYGRRKVTVWGERRTVKRLAPDVSVRVPEAGAKLPFGGRCFAIGRPRRAEMPLWVQEHAALAFGDALVTTGGRLRVWSQDVLDDHRRAFYRDRFVPTLEPLLELPVERVLVTHGAPVLEDGAGELRRALTRPPWFHRGVSARGSGDVAPLSDHQARPPRVGRRAGCRTR